MASSDALRLRAHERKLRRLAAQLTGTGFISSGSVVSYSSRCGKPNCHCHADPPQLHGPYWQWTFRPTGGKTVTRKLNQQQAHLYQQWIANRRRLLATLDEMEDVSRQATEILLAGAKDQPLPSSGDGQVTPQPPARRISRQLAEALASLSELAEPLTEAAQEWLDAKDDGDREAIAEARGQLLAAIDQSDQLLATINLIARHLGRTPSPP